MRSLTGTIALIIGIFGAFNGDTLLLSASAITFLVLYLRAEGDFEDISVAIDRLARVNEGGRVVEPGEFVISDRAQEVIDNLIGVGARMNALSWESEADNRAGLSFEREVRVDDFKPEELFSEIVKFIQERFRSRSGAIVFRRGEDSNWQAICFGTAGQKFEAKLKHIAGLVFSPQGDQFIGVRDGVEERSVFSDFEQFGLRFSIISKFREQDRFGYEGIVWLGYPENRIPTKTEISWSEALCRFINLQLNTKTKMRDIHGELRRAQTDTKAQTRFFADLSHDVRTPLNNLKNILALAKFEETSTETRSMLEAAMDNCDHVAEMMEDILIYSQSQVGAIKATPRAISLVDVLPKLIGSFKGSAELKGLPIIQGDIPAEAVVTMDPKHFRRILTNLISNALKYTDKGHVSISVKASSADAYSVFVRDTGVGISTEDLGKLFTPFNRFERTSSVDGVGLGLALSKILADANGAQLKPSSKLGYGTEFELVVPRVVEFAPQQTETKIKLNERATILLVDDDSDYLKSSTKILERFNYEVFTASSGKEAAALMKMVAPAVIVSDGSMPNGGGEDVCLAARELGIPVLVVSGRSDTVFTARMYKLGAIKVLLKPVSMEDLAAELASILLTKSASGLSK